MKIKYLKSKETVINRYGKDYYYKMGLKGGRKRILKDKKCGHCGIEFRPKNSLSKFCSYQCAIKEKPRKGRWVKCICDKEVWVIPSREHFKNVYCSKSCFQKYITVKESKVSLKCVYCDNIYTRYRSALNGRGSRFCNIKCHHNYKKERYYMTKKANSTDKAKLKKLLWGTFSLYIRQRDKGICISCGKTDEWKNTDAGHYVPKTAGLSLYFDEVNVNCQCTYCNRWMHGNLSRYAIALRKKYGENVLENLEAKRTQFVKFTVSDYQEMIEKYKILLRDFE